MPNVELPFQQSSLVDKKQINYVEIYLPKSIEFLSELYQLLRDKTMNRLGSLVLEGFSIYEADGVFRGEILWEQRTLVIRILRQRSRGHEREKVETPRNCRAESGQLCALLISRRTLPRGGRPAMTAAGDLTRLLAQAAAGDNPMDRDGIPVTLR